MKNKRDFLSITDLSAEEIQRVLSMAVKLKNEEEQGSNKMPLQNKHMVMLFEKPSLRTKLSFDVGFTQLGGHAIYFAPAEVGLGKRETISDVGKVISSMADVIVARVFNHDTLKQLAEISTVPVINALSDVEHPCQILADLLTILEIKGKLAGIKLAYMGDGENNVAHSLALASGLLGIHFVAASPKGYWIKPEVLDSAQQFASISGSSVSQTDNPREAAHQTDVVYTDTWVSMGDEQEKEKRSRVFPPFQVTRQLMSLAQADAIFMHDMPAYRGAEVEAEVIDGSQSVIFQQAENRLHAQKSLLLFLLKYVQATDRIKVA